MIPVRLALRRVESRCQTCGHLSWDLFKETVPEYVCVNYNVILTIDTYSRRAAHRYTIMMAVLRIYHQKSISTRVQIVKPRLWLKGYICHHLGDRLRCVRMFLLV